MTVIGSLFTGYGGLDMAVRMALDPSARLAWTSDVEPGPCRLAAVRWPGVPNLGDVTQVDWSTAEPVDIICGGSPCQDLSLAGRRAGMAPGTRSGLWQSMFEAIKTLRPSLVVWENVKGSLTSGAFSFVESEQGLLGDGANGPLLRAAGRVVGDLASIGYDAQWCTFRASDVGAPHQRERLFITGHPAGKPWQLRGLAGTGEAAGRGTLGKSRGSDRAPGTLIPTPQATNATASSAGYGANLHEVARELLPNQWAGNSVMGLPRASGKPPEKSSRVESPDYGVYAPAIARWEQVLGRPAPAPTVPPTREGGRARLSTRFVEWIMGVEDGHVTGGDLGLTREQQLRLLGNGVVPQQGAAAIYKLTKNAIKEAA